ncbi:MAG: ABC transporter ATP-binding protein [Flavobacteriia bacterium]|nr:ABC transporter ATP-binding protein [Flavobacteriia bacterium]
MKSLSYLNKYFYAYRWHLLLGILFITIQNYFYVKMPIILGEAAESFREATTKSTAEAVSTLAFKLAGLYILYSIIKGVFLFLTRQTIIVMSRRIEFDLKNEVYRKYQQLHYTFFKSQSTGDLMNRISEDVSQVRQYLGPGIMYTVNLAILFPLVSYQMIKISWELTIYTLIPLPIMGLLIYFVSNKMNRLSKSVQQQQSQLSTIGQETFSGIRVIKAYIQEKQTQQRFSNASQEYHKRNMRLVLTNALFMPTITFLIGASVLITVYVGGLLSYSENTGPGQVNPGNIITFIGFVMMLTWPFASVGWVTSIIQRASASQQRINEFLQVEPDIKNHTTGKNEALSSLTFNNVSYHYPGTEKNVLEHISFSIKRGETLGIIGRTGCGKSTLTHLLLRQIEATEGNVLYNNTSLSDINLDQFRKEIGVVPQDVFLFSDSIRNNIAFGSQGTSYDQAELEQAASDAHVLHNILAFDEGFDTLLGERGVNLSGGQKQRVSIARALIRQPQLLVLDDCLSAVDTETEEIILRNLRTYTERNGTTTVIVSHRISSLRNADKILVMEEGKVVETGSHETLMQSAGLYAQMYEKQLMESENEL